MRAIGALSQKQECPYPLGQQKACGVRFSFAAVHAALGQFWRDLGRVLLFRLAMAGMPKPLELCRLGKRKSFSLPLPLPPMLAGMLPGTAYSILPANSTLNTMQMSPGKLSTSFPLGVPLQAPHLRWDASPQRTGAKSP